MHPPTQTSRWRRILQNLALFVGTLFLCFAACEIVLRISGYGNLEIYAPDERLYWKLKPNQDCYTKVGHKPVHVNSHGTRGPEFSTSKPTNTVRVISLGDSRTFGWGLSDEETYSRQLEQLLQNSGDSRRFEVINAGVNAWSYPQMQVFFREIALSYQPDAVVIGDANLWTQFSEQSSPEFVRSFLRRVWLKNFLRRFALYHYFVEIKLESFYQRHRTKFIPVDPKQDALFKEQQQKDPNAVFQSAIEGLSRLALDHHVKVVLLHLPTAGELTSPDSALILAKRTVQERLQLPLVDMKADLQPGGLTNYLEADPVHFTAQANAMIARRLFVTVTNLITP
jgi:hypothetical protein